MADADTALSTWHHLVRTRDTAALRDLLADDAVFHSPVVHSPQRGRALTHAYLSAAFQVFFGHSRGEEGCRNNHHDYLRVLSLPLRAFGT